MGRSGVGALAARPSLGSRGTDLLARRLGHLSLPGPPAFAERAQGAGAASGVARQRAPAHRAGDGGPARCSRHRPGRPGPEARCGAEELEQPLRQPRGSGVDDRRGALAHRRAGAHAGRGVDGGVRRRRPRARQGHRAEARRLLREHLMAITVLEVQRVAVIGAGTMGTGIAQVAARAGYVVELFDVATGAAQRALERIADSLARAVEKGRCTAQERDEALRRLSASPDLEKSAAQADLIVEAAPEDLALKKELFARLSRAARPEAILASNTSSLPITAIAAAAKGPERVIGLHFFNPVPAMKLLEIVQGERTHPLVVTAARAVGARMGKEVVVVRDAPGFATSRLGIALALEAIRMVEEGVATAEEIDRAIELGYGHPMGPLKLTDHVGLDVRLAIAEHLIAELGDRFRPPQLLRRMVRAGKLGKKTGEGFYKY